MRVLVLAPHTDDAEFGAGATISKLLKQGAHVRVVAYSKCNNEALEHEFNASMDLLGVTDRAVLDIPVRQFPAYRQELLDHMVQAQRLFHPDMVLLPNTDDVHQDHQAVAAEALRAFKTSTMLGYELPWNSYTFASTAFQVVSEDDVRRKVTAMQCYKSQSARPYASEHFIRSLATVRGTAISAQFAEAFQSIRHIIP